MKIARFIATVRPWRASQCVGRVRSMSKDYIKHTFPVPARLLLEDRHPADLHPAPFETKPQFMRLGNARAQRAKVEEVRCGQFNFHGINPNATADSIWEGVGNLIYDFEVHSFGFLDAFRQAAENSTKPEPIIRDAREVIREWIENCPYPHHLGWHPEVISRRVLNWIKFLIAFPAPNEDGTYDSLSQQIFCLEKNVETFLPGTQLIENGIALTAAGLYFFAQGMDKAPQRWLTQGINILRPALDEQILPGGGHIQRSPMYQCLLLEKLTTLYNILLARKYEQPWLRKKILVMAHRLKDLLHPDGDIPLFNDSVFGYAPRPNDVLAYVNKAIPFQHGRSRSYEDDGYYAFSDNRSFMVMDGGPIGPEYLPSHGHADTLSYEMSVGSDRVIVDAGVCNYDPGPERDYCRGTAAHNTVVVDGADQSEMWRSFRVGHRAHSYPAAIQETDNLTVFEGGHDGYMRLHGSIEHKRKLVHIPDKFYLVADFVNGIGRHRLESHIHLAHGLQTDQQANRINILRGGQVVLQIIHFGCGMPSINFNRYYPEFGTRLDTHDIVLTVDEDFSAMPHGVRFGYFLIPGNRIAVANAGFAGPNGYFTVQIPGAGSIDISWDGTTFKRT